MVKKKSDSIDQPTAELIAIKRLLIFSLLKSGASQLQIANALGVNQSQISRMFPDGINSRANSRKKKK